MERFHPDTHIDWSNPDNHAEQHVIRYEDHLIDMAALDAEEPVDGLSIQERRSLRFHGIDTYRRGFIATGGSPERADSLIAMGNDMQGAPPHAPKEVTHKFTL